MNTPIKPTFAGALAVAAVLLTMTACGSSSKQSTTASSTSSTSSASSTASASSTTSTSASAASASPTTATAPAVTTGPVRVTLHGSGHNPTAGKLWSYSVHVTDAGGHPLSGTVDTDFVVGGLGVVGKETPPVHPLKNGVLNDQVTFPAQAAGEPLMLVTVVHTSAGSVAVGWPVSVTK
jgi:hypothetical protein